MTSNSKKATKAQRNIKNKKIKNKKLDNLLSIGKCSYEKRCLGSIDDRYTLVEYTCVCVCQKIEVNIRKMSQVWVVNKP